MAERKIVRATFSLDQDVYDELEKTAKAQKRSKSSMVNYLLYMAFAAGEKPPDDIPDKNDDD